MNPSAKTKVKRSPSRGIYEREHIYPILDRHFMCHVAFVQNGQVFNIPTMYGRKNDHLYVHGATVSRLITELEKGIDVCISIAQVQDLVLARSAFHHSLNYESVVVFGKGYLVEGSEKLEALKQISDHAIPGRWEEVREPNQKELKATKVIRIEMTELSAKARTGPPVDDKQDYKLPIWAGLVPYRHRFEEAIPDEKLPEHIEVSESIINKTQTKG